MPSLNERYTSLVKGVAECFRHFDRQPQATQDQQGHFIVNYPAVERIYTVTAQIGGYSVWNGQQMELGRLDVFFTKDDNPTQRRLLEMRILFDNKGNIVGLDRNRFMVWYENPANGNVYQMFYDVDPGRPDTTILNKVSKFDQQTGKSQLLKWKNVANEVPQNYPATVNWIYTYDRYIRGILYDWQQLPLTGNYIQMMPLISVPSALTPNN